MESLNIVDKVKCPAKADAFITLKDHKEGFSNDPKHRQINPAKSELGKVSKTLLENINKKVKEATFVNQWHNTNEVIQWFKNMNAKKKCTFVQFDIEELYPSIFKVLVEKALLHASNYMTITNDTKQIIMYTRKSLLFSNNHAWEKKFGDP